MHIHFLFKLKNLLVGNYLFLHAIKSIDFMELLSFETISFFIAFVNLTIVRKLRSNF